jgi:hypothetical protein
MTTEEFLKQEFITLREEIKETKRRMFLVVVLGTLLVLVGSFVVEMAAPAAKLDEGERSVPTPYGSLGSAAIPYVVLLLILLYVAEQNSILRCGRYVKEHIEPKIADTIGWERWLESQPGHRRIDKAFLASFLVIFLIYYCVSVGVAANALANAFGETWSAQIATISLVPYVAGGLWAFIVALRHWHAMTRTTDASTSGRGSPANVGATGTAEAS